MGDHTDYNDGFVLPMALDRDTVMAFSPRTDGVVRLVSEHGEATEFALQPLEHGEPQWSEYVRGVAWALHATTTNGFDGAVASDVPIGASLSSSASLELVVALAFRDIDQSHYGRVELAQAAQRAENEWVGMACGIMDQLSVTMSIQGSALLIDCRSLETEHVSIPSNVTFVVLDTSTRRQLTSSGYNDRRRTCERAARTLGVASLRQLGLDDLPQARTVLDANSNRRVRHVLSENERVVSMARALEASNRGDLGALMFESHVSLRDDYEVSSPEQDSFVEAALKTAGCFGARMTGAGFGGCSVAAVATDAVESFVVEAESRFARSTGLRGATYPSAPGAGAEVTDA
jgi:galactokinase